MISSKTFLSHSGLSVILSMIDIMFSSRTVSIVPDQSKMVLGKYSSGT